MKTCLLTFIILTLSFTAHAQEQKMQPLEPAEQAFNQGLEQQGLNNLDAAIALYTRALELDKYLPDAYNNRGKARMDKGDYANAILDFTEAIKYRPDSFEAMYNRGIANFFAGNHEAAINDLTRTIERRPAEANAYNVRGSSYRALKKPLEAISDYNKAIEIFPQPDAVYNRGVAHDDLGKKSLALADYTRAIELNPNFAQATPHAAQSSCSKTKTRKPTATSPEHLNLMTLYAPNSNLTSRKCVRRVARSSKRLKMCMECMKR